MHWRRMWNDREQFENDTNGMGKRRIDKDGHEDKIIPRLKKLKSFPMTCQWLLHHWATMEQHLGCYYQLQHRVTLRMHRESPPVWQSLRPLQEQYQTCKRFLCELRIRNSIIVYLKERHSIPKFSMNKKNFEMRARVHKRRIANDSNIKRKQSIRQLEFHIMPNKNIK